MTTNDHLNIIRVLQSVYSGKKIFVECFPTDNGAVTIPNSNFAVKEVDISKLPESPLPSKGQEGEADERITNEGLRNFLINADKPHYIGKTREIINLYYREEISLSRLNEMLNEIVYHWKTKAPAP